MKAAALAVLLPVILSTALRPDGLRTRVAQDAAPSEFSKLTLRIESKDKKYLKLEPVPLTVSLANDTGKQIQGHTALQFSSNHIELFVGPDGGAMTKVEELSPIKAHVWVVTKPIKPGEVHTTQELLTLNLGELFPSAGKYKLQAVLHDAEWEQEVRSNTITIHIEEPAGVDAAAHSFIQNSGQASYFFTGVELAKDQRALNMMEVFASDFGASRYVDYADYLLGQSYLAKGERHRAKEKFMRLERKSGFVYSDKVKEYLGIIEKKEQAAAPGNP